MPDAPRDPWPLRHLVLRTRRLVLRPDDDEGLYELAELALHGINPPEQMPFGQPWTDQAPEDLVRGVVQYNWDLRSRLSPSDWRINFLVRHDGRVIGVQDLKGKDFAITREVSTGSWLGAAHQGFGFGTEMRSAVLLLAFDHLDATAARSAGLRRQPDVAAGQRKLGYRTDGTKTHARRGTAAIEIQLVVEAAHFVRPQWTLEVAGLESCPALLGAT